MIQTQTQTQTVSFYTLGCKLNFSETATIARDFAEKGYEKVDFDTQTADIYVINTCSVTANADKEFKSIVKKILIKNPDAFVIAIGCYAQLKPDEIGSIPGVDLVLGAKEKFNISQYIEALTKEGPTQVHSCAVEEANLYISSYSIGDRTRGFLKVQDGCDYKCTYCTIPLARGISRSDTLENICKNAQEIASKGIKEIVLTGVNIGDYGKGEHGDKHHKNTFLELVCALDTLEAPLERFRISSIEPNLLNDEIISFTAQSKRFAPHFHIPLQSGSDKILKRMRRRYLRDLYENRVSSIKHLMPHACIGVDVIVGFPGETDEDFNDTYLFLNKLNVSYLHVFTYSERDNTLASKFGEIVPKSIRNRRNQMLRTLSAKKRRAFYEEQLGTDRTVLWEGENKAGYLHGFTENYVKVRTFWNPALVNSLQKIRLEYIDPDGFVRSSVFV